MMKVTNRMLLMGTMLIFAGSIHSMAPQVRRKLKREIEAGIKDMRTASLDENIEQKVKAIRKNINRFATPYKSEADRYRKELNDVLATRKTRLAAVRAPLTEQERIIQELERLLTQNIDRKEGEELNTWRQDYYAWRNKVDKLIEQLPNRELRKKYRFKRGKKTAKPRSIIQLSEKLDKFLAQNITRMNEKEFKSWEARSEGFLLELKRLDANLGTDYERKILEKRRER